MAMTEKWHNRVGALIRDTRTRRHLTQTQLAELLSEQLERKIPQSYVSDHEMGRRWANSGVELVGAYAEVLGIPLRQMYDAMGLPYVEVPKGEPQDFAEIVAADATLSDAAKEHLLNQYGLLQMATEHERRGEHVLRPHDED